MHRLAAAAATFLLALTTTSCSFLDNESESTSPSPTSSPSNDAPTLSSPPPSSSEAAQEKSPVSEPPSSAEAAPDPEEKPYVVECLAGTPGPALWSDGTTAYSEDCYQQGIAGRGDYQCPGTDAFVHDPAECNPTNLGEVPSDDGTTPSQGSTDESPAAGEGACPAAECGYGENSQGQRNPTSGEIQTLHGCQEGYINDPELCEAVAWVEHHDYG